jgi:hypothetical protein
MPARARCLVVFDLSNAAAAQVADGALLTLYDAERLVRRGGLQLHRVLGEEEAAAVAERLRAAGITSYLVPEAEARQAPLQVLRGEQTGEGLLLKTPEGALPLRPEELLLLVSGPITREPAPDLERGRGVRRLPDGWCAHLHRLLAPRPVELDPSRIELGFTATGSTHLEVGSWLQVLGREVPHDVSFRHEAPALGPPPEAEADPLSPWTLSGIGSRRAGRQGQPRPVHDNLAQFRFYSGWRAAVERRRRNSRAHRDAC